MDNSVAICTRLPDTGEWTAPCDLTGCENNKKKPMRIRFHPSTIAQASADEQLAATVNESAIKLIEEFLSAHWSREPIQRPDVRLQQLEDFQRVLLGGPRLTQIIDRVTLCWPLNGSSPCSNSFVCSSFVSALALNVAPDGTCADLVYTKEGIHRRLLRIESETSIASGHFELASRSLRVIFNRVPITTIEDDQKRLPVSSWQAMRIYAYKSDTPLMLTSPYARIEQLRRSLESSVSNNVPSSTTVPCKSSSTSSSQRRPLTVVWQNANNAVIQISAHPANSTTLFPADTDSSAPLRVLVHSTSLPMGDNLASSPAESCDSGVSSMSSEESAGHALVTSDSRRQAFWRHRSISECVVGVNSTCTGLKGILKSRPVGQSTVTRSVSECGDREDDEQRAILRCLNEQPVENGEGENDCENDDEDGAVEGSQLSINDDVENGSCPLSLAPIPSGPAGSVFRKKRVSFSERVQERSFRPNASILGQRKKNARKAKCKNNKRLASSQQSVSSGEESEERGEARGIRGQSTTDESDGDGQENVTSSTPPITTIECELQSRADSGISEHATSVTVHRRKEFIVSGPISLHTAKSAIKNVPITKQQRTAGEKRRESQGVGNRGSMDSGVSDDDSVFSRGGSVEA